MLPSTQTIEKEQLPSSAIGDYAPVNQFERKFVCPEESMRYAGSLEQIFFTRLRNKHRPTVIEFGSGTGSPVISAILNSGFTGIVHGYEINAEAADTATKLIEENGLAKHYVVYTESFFESVGIPKSDYLIANPPYLPSKNCQELTLPLLCGGPEGNDVSKRILSSGYQNVFLQISSYSNPVAVIEHAKGLGYKVADFQITQMPMGVYSRQDVVQKRLHEMKEEGKSFFTNNCYLVGGAFFSKEAINVPDLSIEFLASLASVG